MRLIFRFLVLHKTILFVVMLEFSGVVQVMQIFDYNLVYCMVKI